MGCCTTTVQPSVPQKRYSSGPQIQMPKVKDPGQLVEPSYISSHDRESNKATLILTAGRVLGAELALAIGRLLAKTEKGRNAWNVCLRALKSEVWCTSLSFLRAARWIASRTGQHFKQTLLHLHLASIPRKAGLPKGRHIHRQKRSFRLLSFIVR